MKPITIDSKWLDKDGNCKPNSRDANSENPSTFNNVLAILLAELGYTPTNFDIAQLNANKHLTNGGRYLTNDYDIEKVIDWNYVSSLGVKLANAFKLSHALDLERSPERFSHDEANSVSSGSFYFANQVTQSYIQHKENLSLVDPMSKQVWYRSYDCGAGIRYAQDPVKNRKLICQIEFFATSSFNSTKKDAAGNYHASGKVQSWLRIVGLGLDLEKCIKDMPEKGGLVEMFSRFFPENSHPINVLARELYNV